MANESSVNRRRRLTAEGRRAQLLQTAAAVVATEGRTSALTMERLAADAGVSKALVYLHFPDRKSLLLALIDSEVTASDAALRARMTGVTSWSDGLRAWVCAHFDISEERGAVLDILLNERSIEPEIEKGRKLRRDQRLSGWAERASPWSGIPPEVGRPVADMLVAALQRASSRWREADLPRATVEEVTVAFLEGALSGVIAKFGRATEE